MPRPVPFFDGDVGGCVDDRRDGSEVGTGIGIGIGMVIWTDLRLGSLELLGDWGDNARPRGVSDPGRAASPALIVLVLVRLGVEFEGEDRSMGGARLDASAAAASRADDVVEQYDARFAEAGGRSEDRRSGRRCCCDDCGCTR